MLRVFSCFSHRNDPVKDISTHLQLSLVIRLTIYMIHLLKFFDLFNAERTLQIQATIYCSKIHQRLRDSEKYHDHYIDIPYPNLHHVDYTINVAISVKTFFFISNPFITAA